MLQKIMLALLTLTVIGAVGIGIYDATRPAEPAAAANHEVTQP